MTAQTPLPRQVSWVLEQPEPSSSSDDLTAVRNNTDQMLCLLAEERPAESPDGGAGVQPMGPILDMVVTENILERLVQWHLRRGLDPDSQGALLKLFEMLIGQSQQPVLQHNAVLHPLLRLLAASAESELGCPPALENSLVLLLNQVQPPHPGHKAKFCCFFCAKTWILVYKSPRVSPTGVRVHGPAACGPGDVVPGGAGSAGLHKPADLFPACAIHSPRRRHRAAGPGRAAPGHGGLCQPRVGGAVHR